MEDDLLRDLQKARSEAERIWPYISSILFELRFVRVDSPNFKTLAVDKGWRLYWSPDFVAACDTSELATSLLHECLHCLFEHAERFEELDCSIKDHKLWNIVGDCSINETLDEQALELPKHIKPVRFENFDGEITKEDTPERNYFKLLEQKNPEQNGSDDQDPIGSDASDAGSSSGGLGDLDCGSISGGRSRWYEVDESDETAPAIDPASKTVATTTATDSILRGNSFGVHPGKSLVRAVEDLLEPRISWKKKLATVMRRSLGNIMGRTDYTLMRISRREQAIGTKNFRPRLPAMRGPLPPTVAVILDTSPSITDKEIKKALSEIVGIVRAVGASRSVAVIPCSLKAYEVQYVRTAKQVAYIRPDGDQGTDLREGFKAAENLKRQPEVLIVITDGETAWPEDKPKTAKLVIVLLNNKEGSRTLRPWMVPIILED